MRKVCLLLLCCIVSVVSAQLPSNVTEIIRGYGYPCEDYLALTPDGYFLSLQRIPHGKTNVPRKGVVLFQHGLLDSANGVTLNPPGEGLPFILADNGYEVWLGNNRGNGYSMTNKFYTTDQSAFWDFSFDEMAKYDLPTNIEFVLKTAGVKTLSYIGHSEGTTQAFAGFSINAALASKVNVFVGLAPAAFIGNQRSMLLTVLSDLYQATLLYYLGDHEFYLNSAVHVLFPDLCRLDRKICDQALEILMGPSNNLNETRLPYYLNYEPNPTSVINMIHWSQAVRSGAFQMYDYGEEGNMQHYHQAHPPMYNLSSIPTTLPIALFSGGNDYLADPKDVQRLVNALPVPPVLWHQEPSYAHMDFIWGVDAPTKIFSLVLKVLAKYNSGDI